MKAFELFHQVFKNGLENSVAMEYKYSDVSSLQESFGEGSINGKCLEDGEELLAIWSDDNGDSRIKGVADVILTKSKVV